MGLKDNAKALIDANVYANGQEQITGQGLNAALKGMVDILPTTEEIVSGIKGVATQTNAPTPYSAETYLNGLFERYIVHAPITSPNNWGDIEVTQSELDDNWVFFNVTNGVVVKDVSLKPEVTKDNFVLPKSQNIPKSAAVFDFVKSQIKTVNLFNKDTFLDGWAFNGSGGVEPVNPENGISDYIPVESSMNYGWAVMSNTTNPKTIFPINNINGLFLVELDENKGFIKFTDVLAGSNITTSANTKFVLINPNSADGFQHFIERFVFAKVEDFPFGYLDYNSDNLPIFQNDLQFYTKKEAAVFNTDIAATFTSENLTIPAGNLSLYAKKLFEFIHPIEYNGKAIIVIKLTGNLRPILPTLLTGMELVSTTNTVQPSMSFFESDNINEFYVVSEGNFNAQDLFLFEKNGIKNIVLGNPISVKVEFFFLYLDENGKPRNAINLTPEDIAELQQPALEAAVIAQAAADNANNAAGDAQTAANNADAKAASAQAAADNANSSIGSTAATNANNAATNANNAAAAANTAAENANTAANTGVPADIISKTIELRPSVSSGTSVSKIGTYVDGTLGGFVAVDYNYSSTTDRTMRLGFINADGSFNDVVKLDTDGNLFAKNINKIEIFRQVIGGEENVYFGGQAGNENTGRGTVGFGFRAGYKSAGDWTTLIGAYAGAYNTGPFLTAIGEATGRENRGTHVTLLGVDSGMSNLGGYSVGVGESSILSNTGHSAVGLGFASLFNNTGNNVQAVGNYSGAYNEGSNKIFIGTNVAADFNIDTVNAKTFNAANVTGDNVTILNHGFGAAGTYRLLHFAQGSGTIGGLPNGKIIRWKIIDANTIQYAASDMENGLHLLNPTGTGHTLTPQPIYENVILIGSNLNQTKDNQIIIGDATHDEVVICGVTFTKTQLQALKNLV